MQTSYRRLPRLPTTHVKVVLGDHDSRGTTALWSAQPHGFAPRRRPFIGLSAALSTLLNAPSKVSPVTFNQTPIPMVPVHSSPLDFAFALDWAQRHEDLGSAYW